MEEFKLSELLEGRPENIETDKEKNCYDILDKLGIKYQRVEYNFFPKELEELKMIDEKLNVKGIKNLIFRNKNKDQFFFVIIPREERFNDKEFRHKFELPTITMAKREDLEELLNTHSGAVSIMELVNDKNNIIKLFIDENILKEEYFRFHPNENSSTIRISMEDFKNKLILYLKHDINML